MPPQKQSWGSADRAPEEVLAGGACVGAESLLNILSNYGRCGGAKTSITVGVVGMGGLGGVFLGGWGGG